MSTPTYTPGPWYASAIRTHGADPSKNGVDISAENGSNVAIVLHQAGDRSEAETLANAQLVIAASKLLEAARAFVAWADRAGLKSTPDSPVGRARAAIAQATARFPAVSCSQCGQTFGAGDSGYSHCDSHAGLRGHDA